MRSGVHSEVRQDWNSSHVSANTSRRGLITSSGTNTPRNANAPLDNKPKVKILGAPSKMASKSAKFGQLGNHSINSLSFIKLMVHEEENPPKSRGFNKYLF